MGVNTDQQRTEIEREFISLLINHRDLVDQWISNGPNINSFEDIHQLLLHAVVFADSNNSLLTLKGLRNYLKDKVSKIELLIHEKEFNLSNALSVKRDDFYTLRTKITENHILKLSIGHVEAFKSNLKSKGPIFAAKKLGDSLSELSINLSTKKTVVYQSLMDYMPKFIDILKDRKENPDTKIIRCYIKEIDDVMVTGFAPGTLTLFCGDVGSYKSAVMLNIGINIWLQSKQNVLFVPLEMPVDKVSARLVSRETKIPFNKLEQAVELTDKEWDTIKSFHKDRENLPNKFYLLDAPERVPVSLIRREVEKHVDIFQPSVVIVDYIANLIPDTRYEKSRNDLQIGEMLKDLRHMGRPGSITKDGFAVVSAAQIGREGLKRARKLGSEKAMFYSEDLRGSHEYSADADYIFGQMEDPTQPDSNLFLFVIKTRYGSKTFEGGKKKIVLDIKPEISLIQSKNDAWIKDGETTEEILAKIDGHDDWGEIETKDNKATENDIKIDEELGLQ